jgi:hypothetical protein
MSPHFVTTGRAWRAVRGAAALLLVALAGCTSRDISFKSITFENAPRDVVFDACREVVAAHYFSTYIHQDAATGHIETDPVEEAVGREARHQQVYVHVDTTPKGEVVVELMATLAKLEVDPSRTPPAEWRVYSSDWIVEGRLLDEISGRVLSLAADARVTASTIPKDAHPR